MVPPMPTKPTYKAPVDDRSIGKRLQEIRPVSDLIQVELGKSFP
jgi:hypothetical protein